MLLIKLLKKTEMRNMSNLVWAMKNRTFRGMLFNLLMLLKREKKGKAQEIQTKAEPVARYLKLFRKVPGMVVLSRVRLEDHFGFSHDVVN